MSITEQPRAIIGYACDTDVPEKLEALKQDLYKLSNGNYALGGPRDFANRLDAILHNAWTPIHEGEDI